MDYSKILESVIGFLIPFIIVLFSAVFHEVGHGWVAYKLGDHTAKDAGRLTINPFKHIDLFGTILFPILLYFAVGFPLVMFKPVPINPMNFKNPNKDHIKVALAGPGANLLLIIFVVVFYHFFNSFEGIHSSVYFQYVIKPLLRIFVIINFLLMAFNLLPIPPLDGSWVLRGFLPQKWQFYFHKYYTYFIILFIILFVTKAINVVLNPVIHWLYKLAGFLIG